MPHYRWLDQSACAQDDVDHEVVLIDDGSTDLSLEIARSFEPPVRVLSGPNRGASVARNRGIAETESAWIVFLDADDLLVSGTLRRRLQRQPAQMSSCAIGRSFSTWEMAQSMVRWDRSSWRRSRRMPRPAARRVFGRPPRRSFTDAASSNRSVSSARTCRWSRTFGFSLRPPIMARGLPIHRISARVTASRHTASRAATPGSSGATSSWMKDKSRCVGAPVARYRQVTEKPWRKFITMLRASFSPQQIYNFSTRSPHCAASAANCRFTRGSRSRLPALWVSEAPVCRCR